MSSKFADLLDKASKQFMEQPASWEAVESIPLLEKRWFREVETDHPTRWGDWFQATLNDPPSGPVWVSGCWKKPHVIVVSELYEAASRIQMSPTSEKPQPDAQLQSIAATAAASVVRAKPEMGRYADEIQAAVFAILDISEYRNARRADARKYDH